MNIHCSLPLPPPTLWIIHDRRLGGESNGEIVSFLFVRACVRACGLVAEWNSNPKDRAPFSLSLWPWRAFPFPFCQRAFPFPLCEWCIKFTKFIKSIKCIKFIKFLNCMSYIKCTKCTKCMKCKGCCSPPPKPPIQLQLASSVSLDIHEYPLRNAWISSDSLWISMDIHG